MAPLSPRNAGSTLSDVPFFLCSLFSFSLSIFPVENRLKFKSNSQNFTIQSK